MNRHLIIGALFILSIILAAPGFSQTRARDLGVPFPGTPGPNNAITDVKGVEVGHVTLIEGDGRLVQGKGPVRTGVTAIHPRGKESISPVFGGWFTLNASGEMTGTTWLDERGLIDGPILITNTHSVGVVRDAAVAWMVDKGWLAWWHAPVVAETYDGAFSDINGFHVTKEHALTALAEASSGPVEEGAVGGGTGMWCNDFKGGIGTSSRQVTFDEATYTVGVLVQCNYGWRQSLMQIAGVPVQELQHTQLPCYTDTSIEGQYVDDIGYCDEVSSKAERPQDGSIIILVATDAPLLPHQLTRLAKRPSLGIGRLGGVSSDGSGDIFIAFSTANDGKLTEDLPSTDLSMHPNNALTPLFRAAVEATEEAIVNAMVAAHTMIGADGLLLPELPEDKLREIMSKERN
jgi:L-aminopeptidase/D-esterase-like protein